MRALQPSILFKLAASLTLLTLGVAVAQGSRTTVTWWSWAPGENLSPKWVDAFNKSQDKITLQAKIYPYNDYVNALKLAVASGTAPDIVGVQAGAFLNTYDEFLLDLSPLAQGSWGANWRSRYYELGLSQVTLGKKTSALPMIMSAAGYVWYNKTLLDRYKLKPPTTLAGLVNLSRALRARGITPFVQGAKDNWVNFDVFLSIAHDIAPGKIYQAYQGKVPFTDKDFVAAARTWKSLFTSGVFQEGALAATQYPDAYDQWIKGKAAMVMLGTWNNYTMDQSTFKEALASANSSQVFEFLPIPFPDVNRDRKPARLFGGPDLALAITRDSKNTAAAWEVIKWFASEPGQQIWADQLDVPALKSLSVNTKALVFPATQRPAIAAQVRELAASVGPREIPYAELQSALGDALQNIASGQQTPEAAMAAVERVSRALKR